MTLVYDPEQKPLVHLKSGLPGEGLDDVIRQFILAARDNPFTTWLILPTKRLELAITDLLTANAIPFIPSRICTLDGFCSHMFEANRTTERFLSTTEAKLLLIRVLGEHKKDVPLFVTRDHSATGTVNALLEFMRVIIKRNIVFPECLLSLQTEKSDELDRILSYYRDYLREFDLVDGNTIFEWTIDLLNRGVSSTFSMVFVYGFHEIMPLEQDLFDAIAGQAGQTQLFVPTGRDRNIFRSPDECIFTGPSSREGAITSLFAESGPLDLRNFLFHTTFPTRYAEIKGIATEIGRLNSAGVLLSDIAVIFPDLWGDFGLVEEVFSDFGIPWNAAVGPKLFQAPMIQFLISIAGMSTSGYTRENIIRLLSSPYFQNTDEPGRIPGLDAAEADLVFRYAMVDSFHADWHGQLVWLSHTLQDPEKAKNYPGISPLSVERVQKGIGYLLEALRRLSGKKSLREHVRGFRHFLTSHEIPRLFAALGDPLHNRENQIYHKFCSQLELLEKLAWLPVDELIDAEEFSRLISVIALERDESGIQDAGGVAVLGMQECQHMKFPVVFIGGLIEGKIPKLTTRLPFINSLENARMGTRSFVDILREEQYFFIAALLSACNTLYLSAPLADGEKILLTSAFFERVRMRTGECPWPAATEMSIASRQIAALRAGVWIRDNDACGVLNLVPASQTISDIAGRVNIERYHRRGKCDSFFDGILTDDDSIREILSGLYGPDHVWSVTGLETYATCPFAYFMRQVIGLEDIPKLELNLSPSDRGMIIHHILSRFYRKWRATGRTTVNSSTLINATELILRIAEAELEQYSFQSPLWDATRVLMLGGRHTGPGYFERFLMHETIVADSPLVPSHFEYSFGMSVTMSDDSASSPEPVELAGPDGTQQLRIRGRIDRIDLTDDGQFFIWDYKSGSQHPKAKEIDAGTALQLPLYILAFGQITGSQGIGGGYYTIRRAVERSIILADTAAKCLRFSRLRPHADFAGAVRHSRDCAFAYINGIRSGRFPLPFKEKCPNPYCEFKRICRFDPYRAFEVQEEI